MDIADRRQLGYAIKKAREAAGMEQADLARKIGTSRATIGAYERGAAKFPKPERLQAIAEACGIPITEFLAEGGFTLPDAPAGQLQWIAAQLDRENIERLVGVAHVFLQVQLRRPRKGPPKASRP